MTTEKLQSWEIAKKTLQYSSPLLATAQLPMQTLQAFFVIVIFRTAQPYFILPPSNYSPCHIAPV